MYDLKLGVGAGVGLLPLVRLPDLVLVHLVNFDFFHEVLFDLSLDLVAF